MAFLLVFKQFPAELSRIICSFLGTRLDWRTCKRPEADLITGFNHWTKRVLNGALDWRPGFKMQFPIPFHPKELDYYLEHWTLFGRWTLISFTRGNEFWFHSRKMWVEPRDDYSHWYRWDFLGRHHQQKLTVLTTCQ